MSDDLIARIKAEREKDDARLRELMQGMPKRTPSNVPPTDLPCFDVVAPPPRQEPARLSYNELKAQQEKDAAILRKIRESTSTRSTPTASKIPRVGELCFEVTSRPPELKDPPLPFKESHISLLDDVEEPTKRRPRSSSKGIDRELRGLGAPATISNGRAITVINKDTMPEIAKLLDAEVSAKIYEAHDDMYTLMTSVDLPKLDRAGLNFPPCVFKIYAYTLANEDIEGMASKGWVTAPALNCLFLYMAEFHREPGGPAIDASAGFTRANLVHTIADQVMIVTTDYFSGYNQTFVQRTPYESVSASVRNLFDAAWNKGLNEGSKILIPHANRNTHWYLMCLIIDANPRLLVINSIPASVDRELCELIANCSAAILIESGLSIPELPVIYCQGLEQDDGSSCGIFTAHAVTCIKKDHSVLDGIPANGIIPGTSLLMQRFNVSRFRQNLRWLVFDRIYRRASVELEGARSQSIGGKVFEVDDVNQDRINAIKSFLADGRKIHLLRGLDEDSFSPTILSEVSTYARETVPPIVKTRLDYYQDADAPHFALFYAGCVRTCSDDRRYKTYFLSDLMQMDPESDEHDLEHKFVQDAFALPQSSAHNKACKLLTKQGAELVMYSEMLKARHKLAITLHIFNSIGLGFNDDLDRRPLVVKKPALFRKRVLEVTHYRSRITRWLLHLRLTGYEELSISFYHLLMHYVKTDEMQGYQGKTATEWENAMVCDLPW